MAASRNRGRPKPKLRDYSHVILTNEEKEALQAAAHSHTQHPVVIAILGCVLLEHELDRLLRNKLRRKDDATWQSLQGENGPLRSLSTKISMAHALGIYDAKVKHDLDVVRTVRNAFAHSKKLIDFNDTLIAAEIQGAHFLSKEFKRFLQTKPTPEMARATFIVVCLKLQTALLLKETAAMRAKAKRWERKAQRKSLTNALLGNPYSIGSLLQTSDQKSPLQLSRLGQTENPNPRSLGELIAGLSPYFEEKRK